MVKDHYLREEKKMSNPDNATKNPAVAQKQRSSASILDRLAMIHKSLDELSDAVVELGQEFTSVLSDARSISGIMSSAPDHPADPDDSEVYKSLTDIAIYIRSIYDNVNDVRNRSQL